MKARLIGMVVTHGVDRRVITAWTIARNEYRKSRAAPLANPIQGCDYDWPVGFSGGQRLADYRQLEELKHWTTDFYQFADLTAMASRLSVEAHF